MFKLSKGKVAIAVSFALLQLALAGVVFVLADPSEEIDPDLSLEVVDSILKEGEYDGLDTLEGKIWQIINVKVENHNDGSSLDLFPWDFYGYSKDGSKMWPFNSDTGPFDPIEPGMDSIIELVFSIEKNSPVTSLEYIKRASGPIECSVPGVLTDLS